MSIASSYISGSIGGNGSGTKGDIKFKYLGFTQNKNSQNLVTQETYQGTKEKLIEWRDSFSGWAVGHYRDDFGRLQSIDINQDSGPFWNAVITYNKPLTLGITVSSGEDFPQQSTLDISMINMDITKHPRYDKRWNYYLIATQLKTESNFPKLAQFCTQNNIDTAASARWTQATAQFITNNAGNFRYDPTLTLKWVKSEDWYPEYPFSIPDENGVVDNKLIADRGCTWGIVYTPRKKGIEYFDIATYTITETGRYTRKSDCRWALMEGGLLAFPKLGDFGIQAYTHPAIMSASTSSPPSGYWRCEGGNIEFDGKYYNASCRYTWSPNATGWDLDFYDFYVDWDYYLSASKLNKNPVVRTNSSKNYMDLIRNH